MCRSACFCSAALAALTSLSLVVGHRPAVADLPSTSRIKTIQNLAGVYDEVYAKYFSVDDETGELTLSRRSGQNHSGTYWRIRRSRPYRGYLKTYVLESRINGVQNATYLDIDPDSGQLRMSDSVSPHTTRWQVRYAGKHYGFDAYVLQNIARTRGQTDMMFLSVDAISGRPRLTRKLDDTSHWFIRAADDLPTEMRGGQGLGAWTSPEASWP